MSLPDVHHPSLKRSVTGGAAKIEGFTATLDGISRDIKSIEKWLQDCQIRVEVEVVYYESPFHTDRPDDIQFRTVPVTKITRALAWAETADAKTWRLQFREYVAHGFLDLEHGQTLDAPQLAQTRPLIETPAGVRMQAVEGLGKLVEKIAEVIPEHEPEALSEGRLRVVRNDNGGALLMFAPFGSEGGSVPVRKCPDDDVLKLDLDALGLESTAVASVKTSLESDGNASIQAAIPVNSLRRLGLITEGSSPSVSRPAAPMRASEPIAFADFWRRLKTEMGKAPEPKQGIHVLTVRKWSQHSGEMPGEFTVIFRGGDTLECDTASTDGWRQISSAEIRKVYEVWRDYREGRKGRAYIAHDLGVQNTTWIIPLLRRFEDLMF